MHGRISGRGRRIDMCDLRCHLRSVYLFIYFPMCRWRFVYAAAHRTCQELFYLLRISATNGVELVFYQQFRPLGATIRRATTFISLPMPIDVVRTFVCVGALSLFLLVMTEYLMT